MKKLTTFKEYFFNTASGSQIVGDEQHGAAEGTYADGQDETTPSQTLTDKVDKEQLIRDVINDLEDFKISHNFTLPLNDDLIKAMADTLRDVGIEPTDFDAAISASPDKQEQYLIYGPSSWKGGKGALNDLKAILSGKEPQVVDEEESVPASNLPMGSTSAGDALSESVEDGYNVAHFYLKDGKL